MNSVPQAFLCFVAVALGTACSEHTKITSDLDNYSQRLQSYTGITLSEENFSYNLQPPAKNELKHDIPEITINLREFYALNDCALHQLIAERNTALGKMQLPSGRYAYESALLVELKQCVQSLQSKPEKQAISEKLIEWTTLKQQQLPLVWANLITQSTEVFAHFTNANNFISGTPSDNFQSTKQALKFILDSETEHPVNISELELHLQQLANSPLLARQWRTQLLISQKLDHISPLLAEYVETNQCKTLTEKKGIQIMQNIFRKLFADTIQPLAGELNRYHYQLGPYIEQLTLSPHFVNSFGDYLRRHNQYNYQIYRKSMDTHIKLWQEIFSRCK